MSSTLNISGVHHVDKVVKCTKNKVKTCRKSICKQSSLEKQSSEQSGDVRENEGA